jgi:hypothetical protein
MSDWLLVLIIVVFNRFINGFIYKDVISVVNAFFMNLCGEICFYFYPTFIMMALVAHFS